MLVETRDPRVPAMWSSHPDIAGSVGGPLDFSGARAVYLTGDHGCFLFDPQGDGLFEGHVMLTRQGRGAWGKAALQEALETMAAMGATSIWCRVPRPEVAVFARGGGFRFSGTLADGTKIMEWRPECRH